MLTGNVMKKKAVTLNDGTPAVSYTVRYHKYEDLTSDAFLFAQPAAIEPSEADEVQWEDFGQISFPGGSVQLIGKAGNPFAVFIPDPDPPANEPDLDPEPLDGEDEDSPSP